MHLKRWLSIVLIALMSVFVIACSKSDGGGSGSNANTDAKEAETASKETVKLTFMYWGSNMEKKAVEKMLKSFNDSHPGIKVEGQHVTGDYNTKINTLMASNELPDIAYLGTTLAKKWAKEGKIMDFTQYESQFPELKDRVPQSYLYYEPGKQAGNTTAAEILMMFYNRSLFEEAGVELPPTSAQQAWTWDQFVDAAKKLTKDGSGKHPDDPGFNPDNITQYGVSFPTSWLGWYPMLRSNGGDIVNEDATAFNLDTPEAREVLEKIHDLIYKYHVAPSPVQRENMPATSVALQSKKVAMSVDGQWALLDIAAAGIDFGVGVLPVFDQPKTTFLAGSTIIFNSTKHPLEALTFYLYHNNPEQVDLFEKGLWMPIQKEYYTDPAKVEAWTKNDTHPEGYKEAAVDYLMNDAVQAPELYIVNWEKMNTVIEQGLDQYWTNAKPLDEVLKQVNADVKPLVAGKFPTE